MSACGSKEDMMEYFDVSFYGIDSKGKASYYLEENRLLGSALNLIYYSILIWCYI